MSKSFYSKPKAKQLVIRGYARKNKIESNIIVQITGEKDYNSINIIRKDNTRITTFSVTDIKLIKIATANSKFSKFWVLQKSTIR